VRGAGWWSGSGRALGGLRGRNDRVKAPDQGEDPDQGRLVDSRGRASHDATGVFAGPGEPSDSQSSLQGSKSSPWAPRNEPGRTARRPLHIAKREREK
jgi:hypothetical protein